MPVLRKKPQQQEHTRAKEKKHALALQELQHRDRLVDGVAQVASLLLANRPFACKMNEALQILGEATATDRIFLFENEMDSARGELLASQKFAWSREGVGTQIDHPVPQQTSYKSLGMQRWHRILSNGGAISGCVNRFPKAEIKLLEVQGIRSVLIVPICIENHFWGFIRFDDCTRARDWAGYDESLLRIFAGSVGESIARRRAKDALAAEKERLAATLKCLADGVITTDLEGRITLANHAAGLLLGVPQAELPGRPVTDVIRLRDQETGASLPLPLRETMRENAGLVSKRPVGLAAADGTERLISYSIDLLHDHSDAADGLVFILRDVTGQRSIQGEAAKAHKPEAIDTLTASIAHDFNNMLTVIMGNLSLMKLNLPSADGHDELFAVAEQASQRAQMLTHQLLTLAGGGSPAKQAIPLADVLKKSARLALQGSNVACHFKLAQNLWAVEVDAGQMRQLIHDIVVSGLQTMPRGGTITVSAENTAIDTLLHRTQLPPGQYVRIEIAGDKDGVPAGHFSSVFDPCFPTWPQGSGLGLAIAYSVVQRHNGYISAASERGGGAAVRLYLPAVPESGAIPEKTRAAPVPGSGKILIMDDEEIVRRTASRLLKKLGYETEVATDGGQAAQLYASALAAGTPFDAVILDLTIPGGMGGEETLKVLTRINPNIKAIASSGYSNAPVMANHREYGFNGVISKPYRIAELSQVLQDVLT